MLRAEAEKLVDEKVEIWTSFWGVYIGTLLEVLPTRPWRAKVRVEAIKEFPIQGLDRPGGYWCTRRPFEEGRVTEVGGVNVRPYAGEILPYQQSLKAAFEKEVERFHQFQQLHEQGYPCSVPTWAIERTLASLEQAKP